MGTEGCQRLLEKGVSYTPDHDRGLQCPFGHWLKLPWQAGKTGAAQIAVFDAKSLCHVRACCAILERGNQKVAVSMCCQGTDAKTLTGGLLSKE